MSNKTVIFADMNSTIKTILLTLLTLSVLTIAMIEVSGISEKKLSNLFGSDNITTAERRAHAASGGDPLSVDPNAEKKEREEKARTMDKTVIRVKDSIHNFGEIKEGDLARHTYTVENIGDNPLFIANVATSCGCTAPEFAKEPIPPGQTAEVTLEFNSKGKPGNQKKSALIISNAINAPYSIGFEAVVK